MTTGDPKRTRAFIALDLPMAVRDALRVWGESELSHPALRAVAPKSLHVTVAFLGDLDDRDLERAASVVCRTPPAGVGISFEPVPVGLPHRGRHKRLYAVSCHSPGAAALEAGVRKRLIAAALYEPERDFWPHVTVARVRGGNGSGRRAAVVKRPPGRLPEALLGPFDAVRLTLYLSKTKSAGAEYVPLAQVELPGGKPNGQQ